MKQTQITKVGFLHSCISANFKKDKVKLVKYKFFKCSKYTRTLSQNMYSNKTIQTN